MKPDGGPAFPRSGDSSQRLMAEWSANAGMSLRDWFAGHALVGALAREASPHNRVGCSSNSAIAAEAYDIADAMLAIRQQPKEDRT